MIAQQSSALAAQMGSGAHASRVLHLAGHQMLIPARVPLSGDHSQIWHSESAYHQAHKKFGKVKQGKASISTPPGGGPKNIRKNCPEYHPVKITNHWFKATCNKSKIKIDHSRP